MAANGEYLNNIQGSPIPWPNQPLTLLNGTMTYPYLLQHKEDQFDRQAMLSTLTSLHDASLSNMNWWRTEELQTSLDNLQDYRNRLSEIPTAMATSTSDAANNPQHIYNASSSSKLFGPNIYTGVIRNSRFDFITEEPYTKRVKKSASGQSSSEVNQKQSHVSHDVNDGGLAAHPEPVIMVSGSAPVEEPDRLYPQTSDQNALDGNPSVTTAESTTVPSTIDPTTPPNNNNIQSPNGVIAVSTTTNSSTTEYTKLKYSLAGQAQPLSKPCFESLSSLETYVIERPGAESSSSANVLPSGTTFTSPFDQYAYHGMACFPFTYPTPLPPYMQYFPVFPTADPYCLLRERYKDVAPYVFPTFIQPKPYTSAFPYRPVPEMPPPSSLPYPNPAAMFRAANLIPPRMSTTTRPSTSTCASETNTESSVKKQDSHKAQRKFSSQPTWPLKTDSGYSYTVAAAPSDVMTYLPNSDRQKNNGYLNYDSSTDDDDDDNDGTDFETTSHKKKPPISLHCLLHKKTPPTKNHVCTICNKTFARAFTLKTHQRVHSGERPYFCSICFKTFAQGGGLDSHMRIHTGEKPYKCKECGRSFSHSSALKSHYRRHTGEKPYSCHICPKRFADQSTLTKHMRTHSGDRPYKCQICDLAFTQLGNMNKHMKTIHARKKQDTALTTTKPANHSRLFLSK